MCTRDRTVKTILLALVLVMMVPFVVSGQNQVLREGLISFQNSDFETAILRFREVLLEEPDDDTAATAYFWLAKAAMATDRLAEAERNLEHYLHNFPEHRFAIEARYQQGRLLFMQSDYEGALQAFDRFVRRHEDSPFVANAVYWGGEALFNLGRLDQARQLFDRVIREFPTSFRVEAARYRGAVIDLTFREQELLQLLRWSHEENLRSLDEFRRRERALQEAIDAYQQQLSTDDTQQPLRDEVNRLATQNRNLQDTLRNRDAQIRQLQEQVRSLQRN